MKTVVSNSVPDFTYFRTGDAEPTIDGDGIILTEGHGSRRSWGTPQVNNTIIVNDCDFLAVLTGFSHKHGGGQFWRYFVKLDAGIVRKIWSQLTDDEREIVLENLDKAPAWAKNPGKLRKDYVKPADTKFDGFKIMRVTGESTFESLWDETQWTLGVRNGQAVADDAGTYHTEWGETVTRHGGGYYVHPDAEKIVALFNSRDLVPDDRYTSGKYALIHCECSGRVRKFSSGKIAVTYCKPVNVVLTFDLA